MPSALPQELIDIILNELCDDIPTLGSCILVSRAFASTSRIHIFSRVCLTPPSTAQITVPNPCQIFYNLLQSAPHVASHVRHLELIDGFPRENASPWTLGEETWLASDQTLPLLIPLLVNLTSISLECDTGPLEWPMISPPVKTSLRNLFALPGLTSVRLHDVDFTSASGLHSLFDNSAGLKDLSLLRMCLSDSPMETDSQATTHPQLAHLSIHEQDSYDFFRRIAAAKDLSHLRKLCVIDINWACLCQLLEEAHDSLEYLEMRRMRSFHGSTDLKFAHCPCVKYVCVGMPEWPSDFLFFSSIISLLQSDALTNVEEVKIEFFIGERDQAYDWAAFDAALTRPVMARLRVVHLIIHWEHDYRTVEETLPVLTARSLLRIESVL